MKYGLLISALSVVLLEPLFAGEVEASERGLWTFSAGPAWRARVKMDLSGTGRVPQLVPARSEGYGGFDPQNQSTWTGHSIHAPVDVPEKYNPYPGQKTWAIDATRTVVDVTAGGEGRIDYSDEDNAFGLNLGAGYDFWQWGDFSVGAGLRFAAYWKLEASAACASSAGTVRTRTYADSFLFMTGIDASDPAPGPGGPYLPESTPDYRSAFPASDRTEAVDGRLFTTRIRSDLYQLGIGPRFTWHALSRLDFYAGADALLNLAYAKLDADGGSLSRTNCLLGFGGDVGFTASVTDYLGIYGQVGYEWVDRSDLSVSGFDADIDYSSLVVSCGILCRF